jgi:hypothetical protein
LEHYDAIGLEVGEQDGFFPIVTHLHDIFVSYGLAHDWDTYQGDHTSELGYRMQDHFMPFFSAHLKGE